MFDQWNIPIRSIVKDTQESFNASMLDQVYNLVKCLHKPVVLKESSYMTKHLYAPGHSFRSKKKRMLKKFRKKYRMRMLGEKPLDYFIRVEAPDAIYFVGHPSLIASAKEQILQLGVDSANQLNPFKTGGLFK